MLPKIGMHWTALPDRNPNQKCVQNLQGLSHNFDLNVSDLSGVIRANRFARFARIG